MKIPAQTPSYLISLLLLGGCASGIHVTHYPTEQENRLPAMQTFCWAIGKSEEVMGSLAPASGHHIFFDATVRASINGALKDKGYKRSACDAAEFMIDYRMGIHEDIAAADASTEDTMHDYGAKWTFGKTADIQYEGLTKPDEILITVQHGALHIAAFTTTGELLWHGEAQKVLNERSTDDDRLKTVREASDKAMEEFPAAQR